MSISSCLVNPKSFSSGGPAALREGNWPGFVLLITILLNWICCDWMAKQVPGLVSYNQELSIKDFIALLTVFGQ
jgi:hypothetical protein